jgi:hypothetical protein
VGVVGKLYFVISCIVDGRLVIIWYDVSVSDFVVSVCTKLQPGELEAHKSNLWVR